MYQASLLAISLVCPTLAFVSPLLGHQAGLSSVWLGVLPISLLALGLAATTKLKSKSNPRLCKGLTKDGEPCKHTVPVGEEFCFQHQHGFMAKLRSIPRSRTKSFWAGMGANALGWVLSIALFIAGLPPKPVLAQPPAAPTGLTVSTQ